MWIGKLESKLRSQLELPRIESRSGCANSAAGTETAVAKVLGLDLPGNKVRRAVNGKYFINVRVVEKIERVHGEVENFSFSHVDSSRQPQVHGLQIIATIAVAR